MKTKLLFAGFIVGITAMLVLAGSGGFLYTGKFVSGGYSPAFIGDGSGLTNLPAATATNAIANLVSNGAVFGTLMTSLGVSNSATITWAGHSNNGVGTLVANGAYTNNTGNPGVISGASIGTNVTGLTTDAELVSATNAATLASSVNATNAGNIMFKVGSNFITANNTWTISPLGSGASISNAVDIIAGTSITVSTGANNRSFTINSTASGTAVPFTNTTFGYGMNTNLGTLVTTQLLVTASASAGSYVMVGTANSRSNTIVSISGSNDLHFRAGRETNNFASSNSVFTVYDDAVFARSMTGNGNNLTNLLEKNVAVSTNSTLGGQTVDFSRGSLQLTNFPAGNVTLDAITGFTTSNLNWVTYDIQPDAAAVRTLTVSAEWRVSGFTNATVVAITNGQWAELTITAIIGRRTNASIVFWQ